MKKQMMRKRIFLCLLAAAVMALLAGCQSGGNPGPTMKPIEEYEKQTGTEERRPCRPRSSIYTVRQKRSPCI